MDIEKYNEEYSKYKSSYTEENLQTKLKKYGKKIGVNTTYYILLLYQMIVSNIVPIADKAIIIAALGYFISPLDIIPDIIIGTGFIDDVSVMLIALRQVVKNITPEIKQQAKERLGKMFDFTDEELNEEFRLECFFYESILKNPHLNSPRS